MAYGNTARQRHAAHGWRADHPSLSWRRASRLASVFSVFFTTLLTLLCGGATVLAGEVNDPVEIVASSRSPVANPYCTVPTFAILSLAGQARALLDRTEQPLILIDSEQAKSGAYRRFLLAHECCHHSRGHLARLAERQKTRELAWQTSDSPDGTAGQASLNHRIFVMSQRAMELDADCCAAHLLAREGDQASLAAAVAAMAAYGSQPTGPGYPSGLQRADIIRGCATRR
jgi:hypothetical protein